MATEWEIIIADEHEIIATNAAREAFSDLDDLEDELSRFRPSSDIARLSRMSAGAKFPLGLATYDCLSLAIDVFKETGGAFDISIAPLMNIWRHPDGMLLRPTEDQITAAKERCGMRCIELDHESLNAIVQHDYPSLDLGGIGKGYALDQMAEVLRRNEITHALLHSGTSTVLAMDPPEGEPGWPIGADTNLLLKNQALSGSGSEVQGDHIIDPRSGHPVEAQRTQVWSIAPTAALADALSTAFIILSDEEIAALCQKHTPDIQARFELK
jgi:thiamine biosynthesis lipoprotein